MKNTVKLNEAQLTKIVAENVKKVLSEIDWKTYANASKKTNGDRSKEFKRAAVDAFNDEFSHNGFGQDPKSLAPFNNGTYDMTDFDPSDGATTRLVNGISSPYGESSDDIRYKIGDGNYEELGNPEDVEQSRYHGKCSPESLSARDRGNKEIMDYMSGNYTYDNEKGWHLKESVRLNESKLRKIVAESVKKILREAISDEYEADDMLRRGWEGIKNRKDIQDILDWLDERYWGLTGSQKREFKELWDANMEM